MSVTWNLGYDVTSGGQHSGVSVLLEAFENGNILPGATATQFHLRKIGDPELVTFHGNFVVNGGVIQSGTITGFDAYYDNPTNHLIAATGHAIDYQAFLQALSAYKLNDIFPMFHLIFDEAMTVNGSDFPLQLEVIPGGFGKDQIFGNKGDDLIFDLGDSDVIHGGIGNDGIDGDAPTFAGIAGNDSIFGEDGDDDLNGSEGDDFLSGGAGTDMIDGGPGSDTADYSEKIDALTIALDGPNPVDAKIAGFVEDTLTNVENINGGLAKDHLTGDGFMNRLVGNEGNDRLSGKNGDDDLLGSAGRDRLKGGKDDDTLTGGEGHDLLKGGPGADTFRFDTEIKAAHSDKVVGFRAKDTIELDQSVFTALDLGVLKGKHFRVGDTAKDGNDHILHDDGKLRYDADGKGGVKAVLFAKLKGEPDIDADDFLVVA